MDIFNIFSQSTTRKEGKEPAIRYRCNKKHNYHLKNINMFPYNHIKKPYQRIKQTNNIAQQDATCPAINYGIFLLMNYCPSVDSLLVFSR